MSADAPVIRPNGSPQTLQGAIVDSIADWGGAVIDSVIAIGDMSLFSVRVGYWLFTRLPRHETLLPNFYQIGVLSLPVVALTGTFIGMVLAVQSYSQFRDLGLETRLGAVINMSLVRELGPVLAATMLAGPGRQRDGGRAGHDARDRADRRPGQHGRQSDPLPGRAAVPGLPAADPDADHHGRLHGRGGRRGRIASTCCGIDSHHYWENSQEFVGASICSSGVFKSLFFGAAIALVSCYRGFQLRCRRRRSGPRRDERVRLFVRADPDPRLLPGRSMLAHDVLPTMLIRRIASVAREPRISSPTDEPRERRSNRNDPPTVLDMRHLHVTFGRSSGAAQYQLRSARADRGDHRRERLRQDGAAQDAHRPDAADARAGAVRRPATCQARASTS